jgi:hypothetical protein
MFSRFRSLLVLGRRKALIIMREIFNSRHPTAQPIPCYNPSSLVPDSTICKMFVKRTEWAENADFAQIARRCETSSITPDDDIKNKAIS